MYKGSCLCGSVKYEVTCALGPVVFCHCSQCRKAQGSPFASNSPIPADHFHILCGQDALKAYESSPGKKRIFCKHCGSPLISKRDSLPDTVRLRVGTLDTEADVKPVAHIYAGSKALWYEITDNLPQYRDREPGRK
jgi:hypothetical protein